MTRPLQKVFCTLAILSALAGGALGNEPACHDPCIIKQGQTYYLFGTGRGIRLSTSKDLTHWQKQPDAIPQQPDWAKKEVPGTRDFWAPDISFYQGRYQLYYSISTFGSDRSCIGLATNRTLDPDSPDYKWVDQGIVIETHPGDNWNAIDPNFVLDEKNQPWLAMGSYWSGIKLIQLDPATGKPKTGATVRPIAQRHGNTAIEAAFIVRHGRFYYLFVSFDGCCHGVKSTYNIRVGRSVNIDGPYVDRANKPMLDGGGTLVLAGNGRVRGPGHCAVFSDGGRQLLVHHFYDANDRGKPKAQLRQIRWDDDNWPIVGEPLNQPEPATRPTTAPALSAVDNTGNGH